ncbi:hypothetical protein L7E55_15470 [Pelotomaculum isophthalicicum JI]|uniref:Uncharacterized protein n=1 Tax=Pelotomaculum isophthalicicum JI TaxID=947010 RepID=A0A9X4JW95_9FIRM|nr:hypothetical protein [Pelotomaculum isophthalicicum]MDF9409731.1 hypothetical protein [Pelotomaculum isophthalicicum JI]
MPVYKEQMLVLAQQAISELEDEASKLEDELVVIRTRIKALKLFLEPSSPILSEIIATCGDINEREKLMSAKEPTPLLIHSKNAEVLIEQIVKTLVEKCWLSIDPENTSQSAE